MEDYNHWKRKAKQLTEEMADVKAALLDAEERLEKVKYSFSLDFLIVKLYLLAQQ